MHIYICIYIYIYAYKQVRFHAFIQCTFIHTLLHLWKQTPDCPYTRKYIYIYIYIYMYIHTYIYIYIYTHTQHTQHIHSLPADLVVHENIAKAVHTHISVYFCIYIRPRSRSRDIYFSNAS